MNLTVVSIFVAVLVGGLALGTLLMLIRPRDDEAAALYGRERQRAWAWLQERRLVFRTPSKPGPGSRR